MRPPTRSRNSDLLALLAYIIAALLMSWPLPLQIGSAMPGISGDAWSYLWALGWPHTALLRAQTGVFRTDYIYYPLGGASQTFWAVSLLGFLAIPLQSLFNLATTYNLFYLGNTVLTGFGTYLLVRHAGAYTLPWRRSLPMVGDGTGPSTLPPTAQDPGKGASPGAGPAFVAGLAFTFCSLRLGYGLSFLNLFSTALVPFYVLALFQTLHRQGRIYPALAGLFLGLHSYLDFQLVAFLGILTAVWLLTEFLPLVRRGPAVPAGQESPLWRRAAPLVGRLALLGVVAGAVAAPMLWAVQDEFAREGGNYIRVFPLRYSAQRSYDLLSYVVPHARSTLYAAIPAPKVPGVNAAVSVEGESQMSPDRQSFAGYGVLLLSACALALAWGKAWRWGLVALVFGLLSLGPSLHVAGADTGLPLPFVLVHEIPVVNHIRIPMRYGLFALFALAPLVGIGLAELERRWRKGSFLLNGVAALLILGEAGILPYPTVVFTPPRLYDRVAGEPGDFTVLEIPSYYWRDTAQTEVYQNVHGKRILRAYTNRIAPDIADYFSLRQTPVVVRTLRILEGGQTEGVTPAELAALEAEDGQVAPKVLGFFQTRYAVLHHDLLPPDRDAALGQYLTLVLKARVVAEEGTATLYALDAPARADASPPVPVATDMGLLYLGRGWQTEPMARVKGESARWSKGTFSEILFPSAGGTRRFALDATCPVPTLVRVSINDRPVVSWQMGPAWATYSLDLEAGSVQAGVNRVTLSYPQPQKEGCAISQVVWQ